MKHWNPSCQLLNYCSRINSREHETACCWWHNMWVCLRARLCVKELWQELELKAQGDRGPRKEYRCCSCCSRRHHARPCSVQVEHPIPHCAQYHFKLAQHGGKQILWVHCRCWRNTANMSSKDWLARIRNVKLPCPAHQGRRLNGWTASSGLSLGGQVPSSETSSPRM